MRYDHEIEHSYDGLNLQQSLVSISLVVLENLSTNHQINISNKVMVYIRQHLPVITSLNFLSIYGCTLFSRRTDKQFLKNCNDYFHGTEWQMNKSKPAKPSLLSQSIKTNHFLHINQASAISFDLSSFNQILYIDAIRDQDTNWCLNILGH